MTQALEKNPSQTALDKCFLYRDAILLGELHAVYTQLAAGNLCVKAWLFIQRALYLISTLKKKGEKRQPFKLGLVVGKHTMLVPKCF